MYSDEVLVVGSAERNRPQSEDKNDARMNDLSGGEGKRGCRREPPKSILKNKDVKTNVQGRLDDFSHRITGMGNSSAGEEGSIRGNPLMEKTMPVEEKKKRIASVREIYPHFNTDYARDVLRSYQWEVEAAVDRASSGLLPSFLMNCDPSTYIHDPSHFIEEPESFETTGKDGKRSADFELALLSVQGKGMKADKGGLIGPIRPSSIQQIDAKERDIRIARLREICPHFSVDFAHDFLQEFRWDTDETAEAFFLNNIPASLQGVNDPGSYKRVEESKVSGIGSGSPVGDKDAGEGDRSDNKEEGKSENKEGTSEKGEMKADKGGKDAMTTATK